MKYTKGIWKCLGKTIISEIVDSEGEERLVEIANLTSPRSHAGPEAWEEYRANGFLIAAAPVLLNCTKEALGMVRAWRADTQAAIVDAKDKQVLMTVIDIIEAKCLDAIDMAEGYREDK